MARARGDADAADVLDPHHDHGACVVDALDAAAALCAGRNERLTAQRRAVLEIVWAGHRPIGAYDILEALQRRSGRRVAPPTVYRALDFLRAQGLVHRIESMNAYVGCRDPGRPHSVQFMICAACGTAVELHDPGIAAALAAAAAVAGFAARQGVVELSGTCARCAAPRDGSPAPG